MERKLATIRRISSLEPIEGADKIELATVDNWKVVVAKDVNHKVGDLVVYCEIDSFLPIKPEFEWLRKSSYKKLSDGSEGFRIKTVKLRGQISQGIILPLKEAYDIYKNSTPNLMMEWFEGLDVTEMLGITKYDPPLGAVLSGLAKGLFPSFIHKTDEERIQNLTKHYENYKQHIFYVTEKLDGSSSTFFINNGEFGVCSRNLELSPDDSGNTFWRVARELDLENKLRTLNCNIAIQGELIGESIQHNPYMLKGQTVKFFNAFNIDTQEYYTLEQFKELCSNLQLNMVPLLNDNFQLPNTIDELILYADAFSQLNNSFNREGVVIRSLDRKISFKVISNKYLLKNEC